MTAVFAASASSDPSAATESSPPVALSEPGPVTFAMAVKPGQPVPMQVVTERSAGQFAGQGATGKGIDVALIDTGVSLVPGLDEPGKVVFGPDLSMEGADPAVANLDRYGHGTHLAGIINGEHGEVLGVAPDSRVVSVKVAGAKGETSLAQVVAGIDWVIEHKNDNGLNIRVLNLSLGVDGVKTNQGDIFSAAVERAWDAGIVVVAATGNRGNGHGGIDSPAISPYVIAVGAIESYDSAGAMDWMAPWSSGGNEYRQPDVVAPGRSILSLRVPGSTLDQMYPTAVVGEQYFVGSGTSQSAAVVSGFAAAMLSRNPALTNDQIKFLFERLAADVVDGDLIDGSGKLEAGQSARYIGSAAKAPVQDHPRAFPDKYDGLVTPSGATWSGGEWNGATWSGGTWNGATWSGATWSGATWSGGSWSGATWSGATWSGATWSAGSWS
ncbi:S8 family serine peptidase [Ilumatobacter sp.]|uniref:S8 family serine peptidase n=1 Tax=Ilumatobacter sp. TaxID=1967498 RepID=UPI003AF4BE5B